MLLLSTVTINTMIYYSPHRRFQLHTRYHFNNKLWNKIWWVSPVFDSGNFTCWHANRQISCNTRCNYLFIPPRGKLYLINCWNMIIWVDLTSISRGINGAKKSRPVTPTDAGLELELNTRSKLTEWFFFSRIKWVVNEENYGVVSYVCGHIYVNQRTVHVNFFTGNWIFIRHQVNFHLKLRFKKSNSKMRYWVHKAKGNNGKYCSYAACMGTRCRFRSSS